MGIPGPVGVAVPEPVSVGIPGPVSIVPEPVPAGFSGPVVVDKPIIMCNHRRSNGTTTNYDNNIKMYVQYVCVCVYTFDESPHLYAVVA